MKKERKEIEPTFILNDETIENSYGFYIATDGIELDRFKNNPVMLSDHRDTNLNVIGRWKDITIEGGQLKAIPEFDMEDEDSKKIAGKVNRNFIKGASMGILIDPSMFAYIDGKLILTKTEITEASIVPIPSNKKAIRIYNTEGKPMNEEDITALCLSAKKSNNKHIKKPTKNEQMKIKLSMPTFLALGLTDAPTDGIEATILEQKILQLSKKNEGLIKANETLTSSIEAQKEAEATALVEAALTSGKITADQKQNFTDLAKANFSLAKSTLAALPEKVSLSKKIKPSLELGEVKTMDDFQKLSLEQQLSFKSDFPDSYANLITFKTK